MLCRQLRYCTAQRQGLWRRHAPKACSSSTVLQQEGCSRGARGAAPGAAAGADEASRSIREGEGTGGNARCPTAARHCTVAAAGQGHVGLGLALAARCGGARKRSRGSSTHKEEEDAGPPEATTNGKPAQRGVRCRLGAGRNGRQGARAVVGRCCEAQHDLNEQRANEASKHNGQSRGVHGASRAAIYLMLQVAAARLQQALHGWTTRPSTSAAAAPCPWGGTAVAAPAAVL